MKSLLSSKPFALLLFVLAASVLSAVAHAADSANIRAYLIQGSNEGGGVDSSLSQYQSDLKHNLPFDTFKRQGTGSANIAVPGAGSINVGNGQTVNLKVDPASNGKIRISAQWKQGGKKLVDITVDASKGRPTVLVGPSSGTGRLILLLVAN